MSYVCLAMAGSGTVESRGFRSDYPITIVDDSAPKVDFANAGFNPNDDGTKVSGTITIVLSRGLYRRGVTDPGTLFPVIGKSTPNVEGTADGTGNTKVIGYGAGIRPNNATCMSIAESSEFPMQTITVNITETTATYFEVTIVGGWFRGESDTPMKSTVVQVTVTDRATGACNVVIKEAST